MPGQWVDVLCPKCEHQYRILVFRTSAYTICPNCRHEMDLPEQRPPDAPDRLALARARALGVNVHRDAGLGMPEDGGEFANGHALARSDGGEGAPQVVERDARHAGERDVRVEGAQHVVGPERFAVMGAKDEIEVTRDTIKAVAVMRAHALLDQARKQFVKDVDGALRRVGLRLTDPDMAIYQLDRLTHPDAGSVGIQIQIDPAQPQRFAAPESGREDEGPE